MHPQLAKTKVRISGLLSKGMFQEVLLGWIRIAETKYRGES